MRRLWVYISHLGLKGDQANLYARAIIMANRLNFVLMVLMIVLSGLTTYITIINDQEFTFYTGRLMVLFGFNLLNLTLSRFGLIRLMQVLTSIGPILILIIIPTFLGYVQDSSFFYYHIVVIGTSLIPQLVFVPRRDNLFYWLTLSLYFGLIYFLDDLMIDYTGSSERTTEVIQYFRIYYKIIPVTVFIFLHLALFYLRKVNIEFEDDLSQKNIELEKKIEELNKTQEQLVYSEKMASIGVLSAGVAHEMNNPLNFIQGGAQIVSNALKDSDLVNDKKVMTALDVINEGVGRASKIVRSLSFFMHKETRGQEEFDYHDVLDNCLTLLIAEMNKNVTVEKKYSKESIEGVGDVGLMHQALMSILANAVQSIEKKGRVTVSTTMQSDTIEISIIDTGIGIPAENLAHIMEPFFTTKSPGEGTGIGLSVAYKIIEDHQGEVDVKSEVGVGTEFKIKFPRG